MEALRREAPFAAIRTRARDEPMLKWIRGKRFDLKTTLLLLALALAAWGVFVAAQVRDFVPAELRQPRSAPR
ncbi:MAG: hypothetical protein R3E98_20110 [Gemmatimonadota bacterium]|nr:hypothetical protein [Gemmatimonadota bacterium]